MLLTEHSNLFVHLGGCPSAVLREWARLKRIIVEDDTLRELSHAELFSRLFVHFIDEHANVLLLAAVWHAAAIDARLRKSS